MLLFIFLTSDQIKTVWKYFEILLQSQVFLWPFYYYFFCIVLWPGKCHRGNVFSVEWREKVHGNW